MPTLRTNTLGFAAKKSIHPSPAKKKHTKAIDLTASSPPAAPAKSLAPLFTKGKRTSASTLNPFDDGEDSDKEEDEEEEAKPEVVKKDEYKTVPAGFAPLGRGKPTAEMLNNLDGLNEKESVRDTANEKESVQDTVESEGEEELDPAFFQTEKTRSNIVDVDDSADDIARKPAPLQGIKVRHAMAKALADLEKGSGTKLSPKDKKWNGIYKETQGKMGSTEEPSELNSSSLVTRYWRMSFAVGRSWLVIRRLSHTFIHPSHFNTVHCTPQTHNRIHHILRVFDLSSEWGPCTGISRLERWNRAEAWGLEPPTEVSSTVLTQNPQQRKC